MTMQRWNNKKGEYEPYEEDMNEIVNCVCRGKEIRFGECCTSMEIHDMWGFGYAVCLECYQKEIERRFERARDKGER